MNLFEKFLYLLQGNMERPKGYGLFHLTCILLSIILILILSKDKSGKKVNIVLAIYGIGAFILELLKQLIWSFNYNELTKVVTWDYQWYSSPFQLCTTPIYASIICLIFRKSKIRDYLLPYMSFTTILGGLSTMIMPDGCFTRDILINIHTMYLHCGSFVLAIYLITSGIVKLNNKNLKNAIITFLVFLSVALILDIVVYNSGILNGETFNMFYISPYFISELPVFDVIQQNVPYVLYLFIYIIVMISGTILVYLINLGLKHIFKKNT